ncbi:hypothetical protein [Natronobiforma cellulositropha]|uniref:hypothetical protein n=1 Tax=Natronobiforma cellulositropha TaxID=1679076 RepID=UPI0021D5EE2E|nr:hypothetical protein [Natronobiforma cellulositropha]
MTPVDDTDSWIEYWEAKHDSGARMEVETAARNPRGHWLVVDVPVVLDEEFDISRETLHRHPDAALEQARTGFERFVENAEIERAASDGFDDLAIHLVGAAQVNRDRALTLEDFPSGANTLSILPSAAVTSEPTRRLQAASVTYRCPAGHETAITRPPYRIGANAPTLERCGNPDCSNEVYVDDTQTVTRWLRTFDVEYGGVDLPCVATGRYATTDPGRMASASRLELTGVLRLLADDDGGVEPVYEVLYASPL